MGSVHRLLAYVLMMPVSILKTFHCDCNLQSRTMIILLIVKVKGRPISSAMWYPKIIHN